MTTEVMQYKGYEALIRFSAEDDEFYGEMLDMGKHVISFGGKSVAELKKHMKEAVDGYLEFCKEKNVEPAKPFSGRITYRTSPEHHALYAKAAALSGQRSLNAFIEETVYTRATQIIENHQHM